VARRKLDGRYESEVIGEADDAGLRADGVSVLTCDQADTKPATVKDAADYTVKDVLADYFKEQGLRKGESAIRDTQGRANLRIVPVLGSVRQRKATANTIWTILKASLNHAFREGKVDSDAAWRRVQSFRLVDVPKNHPPRHQ
jgi:hypothetical protein